jgi:hypothetical protein
MKNYPNHDCDCNIASGNSLDLDINHCESEIRADIVVSEHNSVRLWGRILNCEGQPVSNALVKLLKVECYNDQILYKGIAHTISDCDGFYQFELCSQDCDKKECCYKIIVSKAAYGSERVIPITGGNCNPCSSQIDPCKESPSVIVSHSDGGYCYDDKSNCGCSQQHPKSKNKPSKNNY